MARFRGVLKGGRGSVSRLGTVKTGITAWVNGWDVGVRVTGAPARGGVEGVADLGFDEFHIFGTAGSNGGAREVFIGAVTLNTDGGIVFVPAGA